MATFFETLNFQTDALEKIISDKKNILILCHQYPDGDAIGSSLALALALKSLNKNAKILCNHEFSTKYSYILEKFQNADFSKPDLIISVDVADNKLLGEKLKAYQDKIDVAIDHHAQRKSFSRFDIVYSNASATCEILYEILLRMGVTITKDIANCLYTGITTDTGCFKYANVTEKTHAVAGSLIKFGAENAKINKLMFDTKSLAMINLENAVISTLRMYLDNRCAVVTLTKAMKDKYNIADGDIEGIASIPGKIEGVLIGVTLREKENGIFKVSLRTQGDLDASKICQKFGGGGHKNAAGCDIKGDINSVSRQIVRETEAFL